MAIPAASATPVHAAAMQGNVGLNHRSLPDPETIQIDYFDIMANDRASLSHPHEQATPGARLCKEVADQLAGCNIAKQVD